MSEISGIIKNGLQRGWAPKEIYQSLVNSGYNPNEVQTEINAISANTSRVISPQSTNTLGQKLTPYQISSIPEKKSASKGMVLAIIILALLAIIGATGFLIFAR
jgi:hypothetical protein